MKRYQSRARSFSSFMNSVLSGSMRSRVFACSLLLAAIALPQFSAPRAVAEEVPFSMLNMIDPNFDRARIVHGADFDGDGDQDILAVAHDADEVVWYENLLADGSSWTKHIIDGSIDGPMDAIAVDLDKDGDLDVLGASRLGNYVTWWENTNADGSAWTEHLLVSNFVAAWTTRAVDMDRDGDPDVLATAFTSDDVIWMENTNGDASAWTRHNIDLNLDGADCAHAGDLDGDGDIDVAASGYTFSLGDVAWYENMDGSGTVWTKHLLDATIDGAHGANIGDMDGDGNLDILAVSNRDGYLAWWENANGDGSVWTKRTVISGISRPHFAQPADFDGDGDHDILTNARFSNDFFWMENVNGDGLTWTKRNIELNFSEASFADFADIDGDGDLDVVGAAELGDDIAWWENLWLGRRPGIISIIPETTGPTNASTLNFTVTFDRIVTDFDDQADVTFDHNGTAHTAVTFTALPGNKIYNVAVNGITGDGLFTLSINPSSALNVNGVGNTAGGPSADVWIDTTAPDAPISAPTDAGSFVLSATTNFSWTGSSDPGFASSGIAFYQIQVGTSPGASDVLDTTTLASVRTQSVTGTLGATLFARVRAIDAAGNIGPWSADSDGIYLDAAGLTVRITGEIRSFLVDPGVVRSLAFSPDNTKILTAGSNNWAILWDDATGDQITTFTGHTKGLMDAVFSPDGTKVLTGSNDGKAKIWDAATGTLIRTFSVNSNGVTDVAYSPDGTKILAGGYGNQAVLFDVATGAIIHVFSGNNSWVRSVAFSPDGTQVLTGGQGDVAILWNATTGALIRTFTGHTDGIWTVDFSPDGTKILTGSRDGTAKIWNAAMGAVIRTFPGSTTEVRKAIFSPDGTSVLTGTLGDGAKLWDVATGAEIHTFSELSSMAFSVDISSDGTRILVGFSDGTVFQYWMIGGSGGTPAWTNETTIDVHLSGLSYAPQYVEMDEDPAFGSPVRVAYWGSVYSYTFDNDTNGMKTVYIRLANDTGAGQVASDDIFLQGENLTRSDPHNDLNGDDWSDLVLREKSTGLVSLLMMQDDGSTWTKSYSSNWGDRYELLGICDLNGDGRDDMILKYNPSQTVYFCEMNETATSWNVSYYSQGFYEKYDLLGVGDLNGDSRDDLILKYKPSNTVYICLMNEPGAEKIWTVANYSQGWGEKYTVLGVADLNNDSRADLILRYNASGTVYFCHMREGGATWDVAAIEAWGDTQSLLALADLNGDSRKDLIVRDKEGLATAWIANSDATAWRKIPLGDWSAYDILFTGDLNGDNRDDLIRQSGVTKRVEFLLSQEDEIAWVVSYTADWNDIDLLNGSQR